MPFWSCILIWKIDDITVINRLINKKQIWLRQLGRIGIWWVRMINGAQNSIDNLSRGFMIDKDYDVKDSTVVFLMVVETLFKAIIVLIVS